MTISNFHQVSKFFPNLFMVILYFTRKDNGPTIEEYIKEKSQYGHNIGDFL